MATESRRGQAVGRTMQPAITRPGRLLETAAFFILLMVVALRPLLSETYESSPNSFTQVLEAHDTLTPATTVWLDLFIWISAAMAVIAAVRRRRIWAWTGLEIGFLVLVLAAIISTVAGASDKRVAANASADWLTAVVLLVTLANLCRDRLRSALVLAVVVASGAASAGKCVMQVTSEYADTRAEYMRTKGEVWKKLNVPLDDPRVEMFERRMNGREATGFFPYSNAQASLLTLAAFAALGLTGLAGRFGWQRMFFVFIAAGLLGTILLTASKGGGLAAAIGVVLLVLFNRLQRSLRPHWPVILIGVWLAIVLAIIAVVGIGRSRGGLPGSSLSFRWHYWNVTTSIISEYLWTGVGAMNFDRAYLSFKPIEYPEEIKDPHCFPLAILAQWGLLGGVGLVLVLAGGSFVMARDWGENQEEAETSISGPEGGSRSWKRWTGGVVGGFVLLRVWMQREMWMGGDDTRALAFFELGSYGVLWMITAAAALWVLARRVDEAECSDRCRLACLCGVGAFLLHNTIDFALFVPGVLTPFVALLAVVLAVRTTDEISSNRLIRRWLPILAAGGGLTGFMLVIFVPVTLANDWLSQARSSRVTDVAGAYRAAAAADPIDPTPLIELAGWMARRGDTESLSTAIDAVDDAIGRDPDQISLYRTRSRLLEVRHRVVGSTGDLWWAIGAERQAVSMYPESPDERLLLADLLARSVEELGSGVAADAREQYRQALALDAARPGTDEVRRWTQARRAEIERRMHSLVVESTSQPVSSSPAGPTATRHE